MWATKQPAWTFQIEDCFAGWRAFVLSRLFPQYWRLENHWKSRQLNTRMIFGGSPCCPFNYCSINVIFRRMTVGIIATMLLYKWNSETVPDVCLEHNDVTCIVINTLHVVSHLVCLHIYSANHFICHIIWLYIMLHILGHTSYTQSFDPALKLNHTYCRSFSLSLTLTLFRRRVHSPVAP